MIPAGSKLKTLLSYFKFILTDIEDLELLKVHIII